MRARFSAPVQTGPEAHPASCTMGTESFPGVKSVRGVTLTPHPLIVPWSRKSRAIPPLLLLTVRPVQSLSACTKVHFIFVCMWIEDLCGKLWCTLKTFSKLCDLRHEMSGFKLQVKYNILQFEVFISQIN